MSSNKSNTSAWIHCNRCFDNYLQKERSIFILSCYHVACEGCLNKANQREFNCPVCKKTVGRHMIGNNLPAALKELFHPRPWLLRFDKTYRILQFQDKQREHFLVGCQKMASYTTSLEKEKDTLKEECKQLYMFQEKTNLERSQLEEAIKKMRKEIAVNQSLERSRQSEMDISSLYNGRSSTHRIHPTHPATTMPQNDTFDFPSDKSISKSFFL